MRRTPSRTPTGSRHVVLAELQRARAHACRLTPDRALQTLEEAVAFLAERGMLTLTPSCSLPSLFGACHEEPYLAGGHGFASWPRTKWWWAGALATQPGVYALSILQGKRLFLSQATVALVDPLCRGELATAERGDFGPEAQQLVGYLAAAGSSRLDEITAELGIERAGLRALRTRLERVGAVVSRTVSVPAATGGERETSELARWDHWFPDPPEAHPEAHPHDRLQGAANESRAPEPEAASAQAAAARRNALAALLVAGVRAAVAMPKQEVAQWFSWRVSADLLDEVIVAGQVQEPHPGWLTATSTHG